MGKSEDRRIEVDGPAMLLRIDEGLTGCITDTYRCLRITDMRQDRVVGNLRKRDISHGIYTLGLESGIELKSPLLLVFEVQLLLVVDKHLILLTPFKRGKHIILIRLNELIRRHGHIT